MFVQRLTELSDSWGEICILVPQMWKKQLIKDTGAVGLGIWKFSLGPSYPWPPGRTGKGPKSCGKVCDWKLCFWNWYFSPTEIWISEEKEGDSRLILLYKGLKGKARIPTDDLIQKNRRCRNQCSLAFQIPSASKEAYKSSFFPQTIRDWNDLPDSLISSAEMSDMIVCPSSHLLWEPGTNFPPGAQSPPPVKYCQFVRVTSKPFRFRFRPVNCSDSEYQFEIIIYHFSFHFPVWNTIKKRKNMLYSILPLLTPLYPYSYTPYPYSFYLPYLTRLYTALKLLCCLHLIHT